MLLLNGLVGDITFAVRLKGQAEPLSTQFYLGGGHETQPHNFDALVWHIEQFFHTGQLPYPVERTLLTTGLVCRRRRSLSRSGKPARHAPPGRSPTSPNPESTFRRS